MRDQTRRRQCKTILQLLVGSAYSIGSQCGRLKISEGQQKTKKWEGAVSKYSLGKGAPVQKRLGTYGLHHPPYSPDLAQSDFHLFPGLKKNLAERCFGSSAEVKQAVKRSFRIPSPGLFLENFLKLIKWYDKCLDVLNTYVEK
ncbi:histone-lysine N-methyltransferase SETMAR [Trichonephila clavipes]|nr:histone-lysine N-methyltransferase SETMAR [Trichonephila clavipes]